MTSKKIFIEEQIFQLLMLLKIDPSLKGYFFLKEGIFRLIEDSSLKFDVKKRLYKGMSGDFNERLDLIDRDMRHALDVSFLRGGIERFEIVTNLHFSYLKPSPREVLVLIADYIKFLSEIPSVKNDYVQAWNKNI